LEKKGDDRVFFLMLLLALILGLISMFAARENLKSSAPSKPSQSLRSADGTVNFEDYMSVMQRRIKRSWFPPKNARSLRGEVLFKVHSDGSMSNLRMLKSTNLAIADQAMLNAVENAAPFRPLPTGAPADVDIEFSFDYNVFNGGSLKNIDADGARSRAGADYSKSIPVP
jgi:TonB family protein